MLFYCQLLLNFQGSYIDFYVRSFSLVNDKLDIGKQQIQPHGHGWPLTSNIEQWKWID